MRIVYLGSYGGTSAHRVDALRRLGHQVHVVDPHSFLPHSRFIGQWIRRTGALMLEGYARERVLKALPAGECNLAYVDGGPLVGPSLVKALKRRYSRVINYNIDDPFGTRDLRTWRLYLDAVPYYDYVFVVRNENVREAQALGAKAVHRVTMSADEVAHAPLELSSEERQSWASEVLFAGTWMSERGPFMVRLLELGIPLSIFGNRWQKAPEWPTLRSAWKGPWLDSADSYRKAILSAKLCLGLLSKGNRDQSTTRSFEIPFAGRLLCAERTPEHLSLYSEGQEAEFWSSPEECAEKCRMLLADDGRREEMAERGRRRCIRNGTLNENVLQSMLKLAGAVGVAQAETICR